VHDVKTTQKRLELSALPRLRTLLPCLASASTKLPWAHPGNLWRLALWISMSAGCFSAYQKIIYGNTNQGTGSATVLVRKLSSTKDPLSVHRSKIFCGFASARVRVRTSLLPNRRHAHSMAMPLNSIRVHVRQDHYDYAHYLGPWAPAGFFSWEGRWWAEVRCRVGFLGRGPWAPPHQPGPGEQKYVIVVQFLSSRGPRSGAYDFCTWSPV